MPSPTLMILRAWICLLGLSLALACGGGGGGGTNPGGTTLNPPVADITGTWTVDETMAGNTCGETAGPWDHYDVTITHTSGSNTFTLTPTTPGGRTYTGTISGTTMTYSGPKDDAGCPLGQNIQVHLELQAPGYTTVSGYADWICLYNGGNCTGRTTITATKH